MSEDRDLVERQIGRDHFLKLAALAGGAAVLGGPSAVAEAARAQLAAESGRLKVMDWAGYGNDGGQTMCVCSCALYCSTRTVFAASISFCERYGLGVSSWMSSPRCSSFDTMTPLYQYVDQ